MGPLHRARFSASTPPTPIRVQNKYTRTNDPSWEKKTPLNGIFHNGAAIIDLEYSTLRTLKTFQFKPCIFCSS
ncbi:hypothetical protein OPQ81_007948 [Rhizoctonia solani]|nr:hypothetical protein OPQ81_007948 [Rhizoctonia solani]